MLLLPLRSSFLRAFRLFGAFDWLEGACTRESDLGAHDTCADSSATPIAWGELYTALQQGVVDAAENNLPSFHLSKHFEVCKVLTLDERTSVPDVILISSCV